MAGPVRNCKWVSQMSRNFPLINIRRYIGEAQIFVLFRSEDTMSSPFFMAFCLVSSKNRVCLIFGIEYFTSVHIRWR